MTFVELVTDTADPDSVVWSGDMPQVPQVGDRIAMYATGLGAAKPVPVTYEVQVVIYNGDQRHREARLSYTDWTVTVIVKALG